VQLKEFTCEDAVVYSPSAAAVPSSSRPRWYTVYLHISVDIKGVLNLIIVHHSVGLSLLLLL
jgi:hypothetical protein